MKILKQYLLIILLSLSFASVALPPDIQADRYLVQVEKVLKGKNKDYHKATEIMEKIMALKDLHNLELPIEFYFKYAKIMLESRFFNKGNRAFDAIEHYFLVAGKTGKNYVKALDLYNAALSSQLIVAKSETKIKQLIELGADVNAKYEEGGTPFNWAVGYQKNPENIKALIQAGADVNVKNKYGRTSLDDLESNKRMSKNDKEKVEIWLKNPSLLR